MISATVATAATHFGLAFLNRQACPACGAPVAASKAVLASDPPAESLPADQLGPLVQGYAGKRTFFTYHHCAECGLVYCPVFFTQAQLDAQYRHQPENIADAPLTARACTQEHYLRILSRYSALTGDYVEIGCDIGLFAELCARKGNLRKLWLVEPNHAVHAQLRERVKDLACVITDEFKPLQISRSSLSTAVLIHVVDHMLEPRQLLAELREALAPGGVVMIVTHDCRSLLARLLGQRWPPYTLQHPQLFSPDSLRRVLSETGFIVETVVKTRNYFPLAYILRGALTVLGVTIPLSPDWPLPMLGLRFGNIAAVGRRP